MSSSHHPNHIMAESSHQWTPRHIIPQLRHTLGPQSTVDQTGIFTSLIKSLCVSVLTELALLGLGHGRPVPGPLDTNESIKNVVRKCIKGLQISRLIWSSSCAWRLTCWLLAFQDPWCCVEASSHHQSSDGTNKTTWVCSDYIFDVRSDLARIRVH